MAAYTTAEITEIIKSTLSLSPNRVWRGKDLMSEIVFQTGMKNDVKLKTILATLIHTDTIGGRLNRHRKSDVIQTVCNKPENTAPPLPPTKPFNSGDSAGLSAQITANLRKELSEEFNRKEKMLREALEQVSEALKEEQQKPKDQVLEVQLLRGKRKGKKITGHFHAKFAKLMKLAKARKNIFIYGPTGCGKSHICEQLAECLGLKFAHISCTGGMSEGQVGGRLMPVGARGTFEFVISEFLVCYETGGVFLLDEIDAADPNVMLFINSALANGKASVPNRPSKPYAKRHKDFVCIAAANTVGTGSDRMYSGRNKLDMATLDRFAIGKVHMDYDAEIEKALCPDEQLRKTLTLWRKAINEHRLERAMSTRFMQDAFEMVNPLDGKKEDAFSMQDVEDAFFEGWREDEKTKVLSFRN